MIRGNYHGLRACGDFILAQRIAGPRKTPLEIDEGIRTSPYALVHSVGPRVNDIAPGDVLVLDRKCGGFDVDLDDQPFVFIKPVHIGLVVTK